MIQYFKEINDMKALKDINIIINKDDLKLPHVIASYNTLRGIFSIRTGKLIKGNLPAEKVEQIENWIVLNEQKLMKLWESENK